MRKRERKIAKHILTTVCPRKCSYCITQNVTSPANTDLMSLRVKYEMLYQAGFNDIMLTGGEPTCHPQFEEIVEYACASFERVHLATQDIRAITHSYPGEKLFSINFSVHELVVLNEVSRVTAKCPVYASIIDRHYEPFLPYILKSKGFSGLTINEWAQGLAPFPFELDPIEGFSQKINRRGKCMKDTMLLPDLNVITNFTPYL